MWDWRAAALPDEYRKWRITDEEIQQRLETLSHNHAYIREADRVEPLDSVAVAGSSKASRWNRPNLRFYPGRRLCAAELEDALLGAEVGETRKVATQEGEISLTVVRILRRENMPVGDELVQAENIDGISTVESFARWYRATHEPERKTQASMMLASWLLHQMSDLSEFEIDPDEEYSWSKDRADTLYRVFLDAGMDPRIPREGTEFLTEEEARERLLQEARPFFRDYLVDRTITEESGVEDPEAFALEGVRNICREAGVDVEETLRQSGTSMSYGRVFHDRAMAVLAEYTVNFLEV